MVGGSIFSRLYISLRATTTTTTFVPTRRVQAEKLSSESNAFPAFVKSESALSEHQEYYEGALLEGLSRVWTRLAGHLRPDIRTEETRVARYSERHWTGEKRKRRRGGKRNSEKYFGTRERILLEIGGTKRIGESDGFALRTKMTRWATIFI